MMCSKKTIFGKFEAFNYQQSFALIICEECLVKVFKYAFVSNKSVFFEKKIVFTKNDIWINGKNKQLYVFSIVIECNPTTISNLWMSKDAHDIFALLIKFFGAN